MQKNSEKGRNLPKITQSALFRGQGGPVSKFYEIMFNISIQPQLNTTVFLFTQGSYDQYFGVQMQKYSEKDVNCQQITQFALFRGQGGAVGKIL